MSAEDALRDLLDSLRLERFTYLPENLPAAPPPEPDPEAPIRRLAAAADRERIRCAACGTRGIPNQPCGYCRSVRMTRDRRARLLAGKRTA